MFHVLMPFTFTFSVPGIPNPFTTAVVQDATAESVHQHSINLPPDDRHLGRRREVITRRRPSPGASLPAPLSRKRGWVPSLAEPCLAATSTTSTSGYLDTPAKYRDMAFQQHEQDREVEEMVAELPPAKRRRTLAGSIISTAFSAALIGTAVGLTVYRLWRDRGKESEQLPPPPYQESEWVHAPLVEASKSIESAPPTPKPYKSRHPASSTKRGSVKHRRTRTRAHINAAPRGTSPMRPYHVQSESDFSAGQHGQAEEEDEMDWIGDKLQRLIEEGKRALGREVVVATDAQEDDDDDDDDDDAEAWEEADGPDFSALVGPSTVSRSQSYSSSGRRSHKRRPQDLSLPPSYSAQPVLMTTPVRASPTVSELGTSVRESESAWESPELRESMERARARYLHNLNRS